MDRVRIFIDVPEGDAVYIRSDVDRAAGLTKEPATPARVRVKAVRDREYTGTVTRAAWALNNRSRTLHTEVDLPNSDGLLRPGMYAIGELIIERKNVLAVPAATVAEIGEDTICYRLLDGKAVKTIVRSGVSDGVWTELMEWRDRTGQWVRFKGDEQILDGDMTELTDGQEVTIAK
jgi:multidrug efflux pump subunit AcrA (membrane-fusion protein)